MAVMLCASFFHGAPPVKAPAQRITLWAGLAKFGQAREGMDCILTNGERWDRRLFTGQYVPARVIPIKALISSVVSSPL